MDTAVIIGVVVAVVTVILLLIVISAFITVLVCVKHKTTSESGRGEMEEEGVYPLTSSCSQAPADRVG